MAMLSVRVHKFEQKAGRKLDFDKNESARFNKKKVRCYKCQQRGHFARECRAKEGNDKQRYSSFKIKKIRKKEEDSKALITVDTLVDWTDHDDESDGVIASKEFGMIAGFDTKDAIEEGATKIYNLITRADTEEASTAGDAGEFALLDVTFKVHNCPFGCDNKYNELQKQYNELNEQNKNTSNLLKHSERINADVETTKKDLQTKLDNHLVQTEKWRISSKNLFRLIDSSMSVRTKVGLGFNNYIKENELGWDDSAFSVFTTNSEYVEGRPLFNRFTKADSMKVVPPPLSEDYTSPSDYIDLDESQMSYGTKSSTFSDSKFVSNDFVSCDDSDKSSEVNTNDFASSDSSVKSLEPKPNDSTLCASTSSVSTSENEDKIESNVGTPIQEPIIVQDLPSFSCNSSNKNENTSMTFCNKNGYFNKKAGHFRKNASTIFKLCFVCGSSTHLIKDCDFYEQQMVNKIVGIRVGPVHSRNKVNHQNQFVLQAVLLRTGKVNIPPARPQLVLTGKPRVFAPVPTIRQNRPFPVHTDRGYSPSVIFGWWKSTARPMPHFSRPISSYFQTYTPYVPTMYYNHMKYGRDKWTTAVKPSADVEDEGVFDSGCSRSMTGNKERLDDCQVFQGGKVTFRDDEGRITGKGKIQTPTLDFENVYYVKELQQFNLFSISQICNKKNRILFTDTECLVLSNDFKLPDDSMVVLRVPRKHNLYTINLIIFVPGVSNKKPLIRPLMLFCWVFFLEHKDETYPILKDFINLVENQLNKKVKAIRCDNDIEFKNAYIIELYGSKGIKMEYSNARTPQQNRVTERKNKTLIEAARTMLADSKLPTMFWTEAVRTGCYVLNRVLVTSPHNKIPYALLTMNIPSVSHFKPFGCHMTILNTSDHLEETMNLRYLEEKPNVQGLSHEWYFDLDYLTGTQDADSDSDCDEQVIIVPSYPSHSIQGTEPKDTSGDEVDDSPLNSVDEIFQKELARLKVPPGSIPVPTGSIPVLADDTMVSTDDVPVHTSSSTDSFFDNEPTTRFLSSSYLGNHDPSPGIFSYSSYDDEFGASLNNVASTVEVSERQSYRLLTCLFACFLSQFEPSSVARALEDPSWVDAMQEEMQQFKFQNVWVLVDLPEGKYAIGTKWILKNKRDAIEIVVRNKARLVAQGQIQEDDIDYDEVFTPVARIKAIKLFLAFASYMGFMVYQMDVKSAFLYGRINEEIYVTQPKGFLDPQHPKKVYKVVKALYGLHQAPRAWYATISTFLLKHGYRRGTINKTLFIKKNKRDIILVQVYVDDIILGSTKKAWTANTPYEAPKPKSKNESDSPVHVHLYRSMIGSLMYLTASRTDIMFTVNACSKNQVTPTSSNLEAVKKIYLKGQPKLGLWYPRELPFMLEAYSDSDYAGKNKDRKSTTGGCTLDTKSVVRLWV
nr:hypothetical protein [Tanacetum cinerariifolium]